MDSERIARLRRVMPLFIAILFFIISINRPQQRGVWIGLGAVFLIIGLRRRKRLE